MGLEELDALRACALAGEIEEADVEFLVELADKLGLRPDRRLVPSAAASSKAEKGHI